MNLFKLFGTIAVNSKEANAELDAVQGKAEQTQGKFGALGKAAGTMGKAIAAGALVGGAAIAGLGVAAVKMAAEFDKGMREVNTLVGGSEEELKSLKGEVLDLSKEMGVATTDAVPALYNAISAGVPKENAVDFLRVASMAAIGGVTDLNTAVGGLTTALNAFGLEADQTEHVADVLFAGVKAGKTTMDELSASLFQVAPLANAAGVSLEETVAAMSALTLGGTPTSVAATQVRAALQGILKPSDELTTIFQDAGYESAQLAIEAGGLTEAMNIVADAADGDIGMLTKLLGSSEAVQAVLALTGSQAEAFADTLDGMQKNTGVAQAAFDEMNKSASRQWAILKQQLNVALIQLGERLLPILTAAMKAAIPAIQLALKFLSDLSRVIGQEIRSAIERLQPEIQDFKRLLSDLAVFATDELLPILRQLADFAKNVIGPAFLEGAKTIAEVALPIIKELFDFVTSNKVIMIAAIVAIGAAIAAALGPGTLAVLAVVGIITVIGLLREEFDKLYEKSAVFRAIADIVADVFGFMLDFIMTKIEGITQIIENGFNLIINIFEFWKSVFTGDWEGAWNNLKQIVDNILGLMEGMIKAYFGNIPEIILSLIGSAVSAAGKFAEGIINGFIDTLGGLGDAFISQVKSGWNKMISWADNNLSIHIGGTNLGPLGHLPSINFDPDFGQFYARATGFTVPFDNFPALLHRGETVSSAAESGDPVSVFIDKVYARSAGEAELAGHDMAWAIRRRGYAT